MKYEKLARLAEAVGGDALVEFNGLLRRVGATKKAEAQIERIRQNFVKLAKSLGLEVDLSALGEQAKTQPSKKR
ncbi:MAG: hypothetical protein HY422_00025 [Candidatus Komeilibacteria bacterium]|nr:hypothetical protein [Candidatus Komeilibacteria bacterium]